jgi:hypothetical protein
VYTRTTGPLVPCYADRGILIAVDADQPPDAVTADIENRLAGLAGSRRSAVQDRSHVVADRLAGRG